MVSREQSIIGCPVSFEDALQRHLIAVYNQAGGGFVTMLATALLVGKTPGLTKASENMMVPSIFGWGLLVFTVVAVIAARVGINHLSNLAASKTYYWLAALIGASSGLLSITYIGFPVGFVIFALAVGSFALGIYGYFRRASLTGRDAFIFLVSIGTGIACLLGIMAREGIIELGQVIAAISFLSGILVVAIHQSRSHFIATQGAAIPERDATRMFFIAFGFIGKPSLPKIRLRFWRAG